MQILITYIFIPLCIPARDRRRRKTAIACQLVVCGFNLSRLTDHGA